ncbi:uncharacterized protein F4822DRAFT_429465 [Hypoxylon trugodes]|uniref:uncharacterized protein n=1 Tax=Hypoxylon trugodes TaxID=326681 RepID=UPI0021A058E1|nr:uncharacterized protein F4822DRAFT_429465 [Hypoxylon trugodes]KAI1388847.1 hypothetical protein F4822DRAFT_429465 [Hypoxylon trugodes]
MSTNTTSSDNSAQTASPSDSTSPSSPATPSTSPPSTPPPDTTSTSSTTSDPTTSPSSTSTTETPPTTSTSSTSDTPTSTPSSTSSTTSTSSPSTTSTPTSSSIVFTMTQASTGENGSTAIITVTSTQVTAGNPQSTNQPTSTDASGSIITSTPAKSGALAEPAKIAVAVVVPIAAVALLVLGGIFFWRKRKARRDAAEERRKEVEDYSYNPNNDPTLPDMGAGAGGAYEMKEDGSGYRGWGSTTLAGSTGRKASTTMSGGAAGVAYSDATSPTRGNFSDTRSGDGLVNEGSNSPPEGEILGAMGPSATDNRGGNGTTNVQRGPSNASSSYSAAGRSDGSGDNAGSYGAPAYLDQYGGNNPYADGAYGQQQAGGQPVIRDNPARRNTRIENPSHYPQQSAGISQNF